MISRADLLKPVSRWTALRKADLLAGLRSGRVTLSELAKVHHLSTDEILSWDAAYKKNGLRGLRAIARREAA